MIMIKDSKSVNVALVLKLNDFVTGLNVSGSAVKLMSSDGLRAPIVKPGGYFVFTGRRPESVRIISDRYINASISTGGHTDSVLRASLIPRDTAGAWLNVDSEAHVGFGGGGYALAAPVASGSLKISLQKDDLCDITDLFHAVVAADGAAEAVYITENNGGSYALKTPAAHEYPIRGTRLIPLHRVPGTRVPIPRSADTAYIMSGGILKVQSLEVLQ